jgi:uncharacterized membrane protein
MLGLSSLGFIHTLISLIAVAAALIIFARRGKIDPHSKAGKVYLITTAVGCLTAFGLSKHGGFNPGHGLAILTLFCLIAAVSVERWQVKAWPYIQVSLLSLSLFFSLVPATAETLTRLPVGAPIAQGPQDPVVVRSLGILFLVFALTLVAQIIYLRRTKTAKA